MPGLATRRQFGMSEVLPRGKVTVALIRRHTPRSAFSKGMSRTRHASRWLSGTTTRLHDSRNAGVIDKRFFDFEMRGRKQHLL